MAVEHSQTVGSTVGGSGSAELDPLRILALRFAQAGAHALASFGVAAGAEEIDPAIAENKRPELGDFQCNMAMGLAKRIGKPPRDVARAIVEAVDLGDVAQPIGAGDIAGPGFINVRLRDDAVTALLARLGEPGLGIDRPASVQTVVVDLFGVNLAKQMHVGHLRSTIIGDALARVYERLGHRVVRQNHAGDWGLPIAMVAHRMRQLAEAGQIDPDRVTLDDLDRLYRESQKLGAPEKTGLAIARRFGMGPKVEAELEAQVQGAELELASAKDALLRLQSGDPGMTAFWKRIHDITMREGLAVCARLHTRITDGATAGESTYRDELGPIVDDLLRRGVAEVDGGAVIVRLSDVGIDEPCIIRKSDGGFLYATTDVAAIRRRVQKIGADRVVYCIDARQSLHMRQVFAAAEKAGYTRRSDGGRAVLQHAAFGTVLGEDGRPFKTRSGDNVRLADLLVEAVERAERVVESKNPQMPASERSSVAEAVGIAAIKYADLSTDRARDYAFSFDRMLAFEGNTGPYLLYALVRIRSIFRKAAERGIDPDARGPVRVEHAKERALALQLLGYPAAVRAVAEHAEPHRLCAYVFELATRFAGFFEACPVLNAGDEGLRTSRLRLCDLTGRVLADGLACLGLPTADRM